ncbi:MAG: hypothetical protein ACK5Q3_08995, partial [Planctomycetota bacterium]
DVIRLIVRPGQEPNQTTARHERRIFGLSPNAESTMLPGTLRNHRNKPVMSANIKQAINN